MVSKKMIPVCAPVVGEREVEYATRCIRSSWISSVGPFVTKFENKFARFCDSKYGVTANSGTTALHLALAALNAGPNDEVIMPTFTMIASVNAVEYTGARAVFVDANPETWTMDVSNLESKVTDRTKIILPVHIYGHPTDMDPLLEVSRRKNLKVVEDAAEAHGAKYKGKITGSMSDVGSFSFYSNKIITTGEGGMNVTNDYDLAERMRWLRAHAFGRGGKHFWHEELGFGYRLSALQASVGLAQMERIREFIRLRIAHAKLYNELLSQLSQEHITLPPQKPWAKNVYWMYSILINDDTKRAKLMDWLTKKGIETRTFFFPVHEQPYYRSRYVGQSFPVADRLSKQGMNLPSGSGLTEQEITYVSEKIVEFFRTN